MRLTNVLGAIIVALVFTVVVDSQAKEKNFREVSLIYDASLAGSHLATGRYNVQWETHSPDATVTFQLGNRVVATAEGKVVDRGAKYSGNAVIYDEKPNGTRGILEIRFKDSSEVIVFQE